MDKETQRLLKEFSKAGKELHEACEPLRKDKAIEHTIVILKNKILKQEAQMSKLASGMNQTKETYDNTYGYKTGDLISGHIRTIDKLKETIEVLESLEEIK